MYYLCMTHHLLDSDLAGKLDYHSAVNSSSKCSLSDQSQLRMVGFVKWRQFNGRQATFFSGLLHGGRYLSLANTKDTGSVIRCVVGMN